MCCSRSGDQAGPGKEEMPLLHWQKCRPTADTMGQGDAGSTWAHYGAAVTRGQLGAGEQTHGDRPPRWQKQQFFLGSYEPAWSWCGQMQKCARSKPERAPWQEANLFTAPFCSYSASFCLCFKTMPFPVSVSMKPTCISELPHSFFRGVSLIEKG